jgi:uncharacterized protein YqgC (DUF456 family)
MDDITLHTTIIMGVGLLGAVVPVLPGPPLVWLGAMYYSYRTDWTEVSWLTLAVLFLLAVIGSTADVWMSALGAKKTGASGWATLASMVGGFIGLLVFSLPGLFIGSIAAIALVEYSRHKDWNKVLHASKGYLAGYLLSIVVQIFTCLLMIGLFVAAVRL